VTILSNSGAARSGTRSLDSLDARSLAQIVAASRVLRVPAGRKIFRKGDPGDGCYFILEGAVKVTLPMDAGQEVLLAILGRGDVVGEMALLDGLPRSATVTAAQQSELCYISRFKFEQLAQSDIEIARLLLRLMTARLRAGNEAYALQQMPVRIRLARALVRLADGFGEPLPDGRTLIRQKVSQAELGHMIGATRENVNRQLAEWRRERLLTRISGYYCVEHPSAFELVARGELLPNAAAPTQTKKV
jgi:CRP/FNR family cyclic AMP-dependent transcriptional regulator